MQLSSPDAIGISLGHLSPPFQVHYGELVPEGKVEIFQGVIGQDGELIHVGDYVKLSSPHYGVSMSYMLQPM